MKKVILGLSMVLSAFSAQASDTVRFGVAAEPYPPFSSKSADGTWSGFEIDLIHDICAKAQLECEIKDIAWDGIIPSLQSKKIDVIFTSMTVTAERAKKVLFTQPYYTTTPAIAGYAGQQFAMDKATLKGKIIGVQNSTVSAFYIKDKVGKFASIRYYDTQDAVNSDLIAGRIDFMIADNIQVADLLKNRKNGLEDYGTVAADPMLGDGIAAGVRLDDTQLEQKLSKSIVSIVNSEQYKALSMKYFGTNVAP